MFRHIACSDNIEVSRKMAHIMLAVLNPLRYYTLHYGECYEKFIKNLVVGLWTSQASAGLDL